MKYQIRVRNTFQNSYNQQRSDGIVSQNEVFGEYYSDKEPALFDTKEEAERAKEKLYYLDNPDLIIECVQSIPEK